MMSSVKEKHIRKNSSMFLTNRRGSSVCEAETQVKTERAVVPVEVLAGRVRHAPRGRFVTGGRVEFAGQTKAVEPRDKAVPATGDVAVKRAESSPVQDGSVGAARVAASNRPVKVKSEVEASADARIARRTVKRTAAKSAEEGAAAKSPAVARKPAVRKSTARKTAADAATSKKATPKKSTARKTAADAATSKKATPKKAAVKSTAVKSTAVKRASADKKVGKSSGCPRAEKVAAKSGGKRAQSGVKSPAQGLKPKRK